MPIPLGCASRAAPTKRPSRRFTVRSAHRAMACAVAIVPVTVAGIALMRCHCALAAYVIEVIAAIGYLVFILAVPRGQA
jgi:hypothetical protein